MNGQLPLIPSPLPSPDDNRIGAFHGPAAGAPATERAAAVAVYPRTGTARRAVLDFVGESGARGASDEEIADGLSMRLYTAAPRRNELVRDGWVEWSGRKRPTSTGTFAAVWVLTAPGRERWERERSV